MADLRGRLTAFYQRHNPTNLAQIDAILTAWGHNESELWRAGRTWRPSGARYGQRAVDDAPRPAREVRVGDRGGL